MAGSGEKPTIGLSDAGKAMPASLRVGLWPPPCGVVLWLPPCGVVLWLPPCGVVLWLPPCGVVLWLPPRVSSRAAARQPALGAPFTWKQAVFPLA
jgi:hypothetical protein